MRTLNSHNSSSEAKRAVIIGAALECFVEMGFTQATMEKIRERACVSNGSLYHHFGSKEELAAAAYIEGVKSYQKRLGGAVSSKVPAESGVKALVRRHLNWVHENKAWAVFLFRTRRAEFMKAAERNLSEENARFFKPLSEWFVERKEAGEIRDLSFPLYMALILGPCQEYSRLWLAGAVNGNMSRAAAEIGEGVWRSVKAD